MPCEPRKKPCRPCPYRKDVPAGIWDPSEYTKLPEYDKDTGSQPIKVFMCHSRDGKICAGWLGYRDPSELLAVRIGIATGQVDLSALNYTTDVPLFPSGQAACDHGMSGVDAPDRNAIDLIKKLGRVVKPVDE